MSFRIEPAKSNRSSCQLCARLIPKGQIRIRFESYRESSNICFKCFRTQLAFYGISMSKLTEQDQCDMVSALAVARLTKEYTKEVVFQEGLDGVVDTAFDPDQYWQAARLRERERKAEIRRAERKAGMTTTP